jgi:hypothetical protein
MESPISPFRLCGKKREGTKAKTYFAISPQTLMDDKEFKLNDNVLMAANWSKWRGIWGLPKFRLLEQYDAPALQQNISEVNKLRELRLKRKKWES